ncbi:hypothetical protein [Oscillatoria salina]|uniref:hypothetical protein n=1 Tax=Oscillatoria salina TaxID=331517 RepID=UPI001CCC1626|nr:hypothetical protein [Oscillatoria salina]
MQSFSELLEEVKKRPPLYLNRYSIFSFQSFYNGYLIAKHMYNLPETKAEQEFDTFLNWIREECFPLKINRSWAEILFIYSSDERDALDRLFNLFEEYIEQKRASFGVAKGSGEILGDIVEPTFDIT